MRALYEDQEKLLMSGNDIPPLTAILQLLPVLEELVLCWVVCSKETGPLGNILKLCAQNQETCLKQLLAAVCKAISMREKENQIISLQVSAIGMRLDYNHSLSGRNLQKAFLTIRRLHIRDYGHLLELLAEDIDMPALRSLELTGFNSIELSLVESVCRKTRITLSHLHIGSKRLYYKGGSYGGWSEVFDRDIATLSHTLGQCMSLKKVNVRISEYPKRHARKLELLLLGRISLSDCESAIQNSW